MSLRTFAKELSSSEETLFTVPPKTEGTANNILITGTGDVTLKYYHARSNSTITVLDEHAVSDRFNFKQSFNLESGDKLIASGDGLKIFVSVYFVGDAPIGAPTFGPGPQEFVGGDMSAGFFGEVDSSELFTPTELDLLLGFTEGESMPDSGWLKFARNGKILYVQKRPMRHSISWDHIYSRGAVYGVSGVGEFPTGAPTNQYLPLSKNSFSFTPRLLTGAASDPIDTTEQGEDDSCTFDLGGGSEWNELIYRIHQDVPDCSDPEGASDNGGPQSGDNWANYSNTDIGIVSGSVGIATWVQETSSVDNSRRVRRGRRNSVSDFSNWPSSDVDDVYGLRLVLELES